MPLINKMVPYFFDFLQADEILCPNCFDAYQLPTILPLPNISKSSGHVAQGFIAKFYVWEDLRFKEENVGIKSKPQAK
jgi:hypothetical protein